MSLENNLSALGYTESGSQYDGSLDQELLCTNWQNVNTGYYQKVCSFDKNGNPTIRCYDKNNINYFSEDCQNFRYYQSGNNWQKYKYKGAPPLKFVNCYRDRDECDKAAEKKSHVPGIPYTSDRGDCDKTKKSKYEISSDWFNWCTENPNSPYCYPIADFKYKYEDPYEKNFNTCYVGDDPCNLNCHPDYIYIPYVYADKCCPGNRIRKNPNTTISPIQPIPDPSICQSYTPCYDDIEHNLKYYCDKGDQKEKNTISVTSKEEAQKIGKTFYDCIPSCGNRQRFEF